MHWYIPILYPFALIYKGVTWVRNKLFDRGILKSQKVKAATVVVGNLNVGGSGKTPMVEFLVENLAARFHTVTLSRGYGRKTRGYLLADTSSTPAQLGDEPYQIYSKYAGTVNVAVGEKRVAAIHEIMKTLPGTELVLLDDAFQHRYIDGDLRILLTTFRDPFFQDYVLPAGRLRESRYGAARADIIVVTKCPPNLSEAQKVTYRNNIQKYSQAPVLFAGLGYGGIVPLGYPMTREPSEVIVLSGIADSSLFTTEVGKRYKVLEVIDFRDHHEYGMDDLERLRSVVRQRPGAGVITTEKDAVKLKRPEFREYLSEIPIFALPVKIKFSPGDNESLFASVIAKIEEKTKIREV